MQAFYIPSGSMNDTLVPNDRILVEKVSYWGGPIDRGDIVVFDDPGGWLDEASRRAPGDPARPRPRDRRALPDRRPPREARHRRRRRRGRVLRQGRADTVNGVPLDEKSLPRAGRQAVDDRLRRQGASRATSGCMGDNRSQLRRLPRPPRRPGGGFVPADDVVGKVFAVVWPLTMPRAARRPPRSCEEDRLGGGARYKRRHERAAPRTRRSARTPVCTATSGRCAGGPRADRRRRRGRPRCLRRAAGRRRRDPSRRQARASSRAGRLQAADRPGPRAAATRRSCAGPSHGRSSSSRPRSATGSACTSRTSRRCAASLARLEVRPSYVLTDGFPVDGLGVPGLAIWKGDRVAACIAAASVIAKVTRDRIMSRAARGLPGVRLRDPQGVRHPDAHRGAGASTVRARSTGGGSSTSGGPPASSVSRPVPDRCMDAVEVATNGEIAPE